MASRAAELVKHVGAQAVEWAVNEFNGNVWLTRAPRAPGGVVAELVDIVEREHQDECN